VALQTVIANLVIKLIWSKDDFEVIE
jgi:hypothetical protein